MSDLQVEFYGMFPFRGHLLDGARAGSPAPLAEHDPVSVRLSDAARQEGKRRRLIEFLGEEAPAWNPADHPEIDEAGGSAAWVRKMRHETEEAFRKHTRESE
jgi:hypothetical protein